MAAGGSSGQRLRGGLDELLKIDAHGGGNFESIASLELRALADALSFSPQDYDDRSTRSLLTALRNLLLATPCSVVAAAAHAAAYPSLPLKALGRAPVRELAFSPPSRIDVAGGFILRAICKVGKHCASCRRISPLKS